MQEGSPRVNVKAKMTDALADPMTTALNVIQPSYPTSPQSRHWIAHVAGELEDLHMR